MNFIYHLNLKTVIPSFCQMFWGLNTCLLFYKFKGKMGIVDFTNPPYAGVTYINMFSYLKLSLWIVFFNPWLKLVFFLAIIIIFIVLHSIFLILKFYDLEVHQHFLTSLHCWKWFFLFFVFSLYGILIYPKYTANSGLYYWHTEDFFVLCGKVFECTLNEFLWVICFYKTILILLWAETNNFKYADIQSFMLLEVHKRKKAYNKEQDHLFSV